jgi:hypothetical protein
MVVSEKETPLLKVSHRGTLHLDHMDVASVVFDAPAAFAVWVSLDAGNHNLAVLRRLGLGLALHAASCVR